MDDEKDRLGETLRLLQRAREDTYFAQRDRELIEKLRAHLRRVDIQEQKLKCPKCGGAWESFTFQGIALERCGQCGGIWMDKGELEEVVRKVNRGVLGQLIDKLLGKEDPTEAQS
jgi:Zn-finger nucleic acid-binding protein